MDSSFKVIGIKSVTRVAQLTGKDSINKTERYSVEGTDLGSMFEMDGKIYMVFGDTFGPRSATQLGGGGDNWRSNVMAVTTDTNPSDGITFDTMIADETGKAKEIIPSMKNLEEITCIPTSGFSIGNKMYLTFMSICGWGKRGIWSANYGGMARSDDGGNTWTKLDGLKWPKDSNFTQPAAFLKDDEIFFWSTPAGRFGGIKLMKTAVESVEDMSSYVYYTGDDDGKPLWSSEMNEAKEILPGPVGELSVIWNKDLKRWIMAYINEGLPGIELREGINPWGPWSEPLVLAGESDYPILYGSYMHPKYIENDGKVIYFAMSQWLPYNVYWMKAELEISR